MMVRNGDQSFMEALARHAAQHPDKRALTYLRDGEIPAAELSYRDVMQRAQPLARWLSESGYSGGRAMLMFPPGVEFVDAFLACMLAGVVAVPVAPVGLSGAAHKVKRMLSIIQDCTPSVVLSVRSIVDQANTVAASYSELADLPWLAVDEFVANAEPSEADTPTPIYHAGDLAFLQYTSGSTSLPKGVMLSHGNLLNNLMHFDHGWAHDNDSHVVCWLPHYHDLGLIYGILFALYKGIDAVLLPPAAVVQKPIRWLKAISDYRGTHSMGPNFMYALCAERVADEDLAQLDLSSWRMALNAAEPIRVETVREFNRKFAAAKLSPTTLTGGYGLAEAACRVTAQNASAAMRILRLDAEALIHNQVELTDASQVRYTELISCGPPALDTIVKIVSLDGNVECAAGQVGEIWVSSGSVASGYWNREPESRDTFGGMIADEPEGRHYLRTGDLGFLYDGELYISGRIKDLVIVGGENHYPQDIEWVADTAHPALRAGCCAAFSIEHDGGEKVVIVQELVRHYDQWSFDDMFAAIRRSINEVFELPLASIVLIRPGTIHKTSSGKIQRRATRQAYQADELSAIARWDRPETKATAHSVAIAPVASRCSEIESFLTARIAAITGLAPSTIKRDQPFADFGLGSLEATRLSGELSDRYRVAVAPSAFYDFPSLARLAQFVGGNGAASSVIRDATPTTSTQDDIAVIGLSCRFPGAEDPQAFWRMLREGDNGISTRVGADGRVRQAGFLSDISGFDNAFFGINNREAASMDPQQRMALEVSWHALEDAGIVPSSLSGSQTGVFIGASAFDYGALQLAQSELDAYSSQGSVLAVIANRIAYLLNLQGPSFVVDTACSSALTAVHLACRSLRDGESNLAVAGGVNALLASDWDLALNQAGMLAADGQCKTFDAAANGYVRSEGCGMVILKRYADAVRDGDRIYGVIAASGVNQDGRSNGLTAPNGQAQEALILRSLARAGITAEQLDYVETHGTGTALGDLIECSAWNRILEGRVQPCLLGAAKANVGHLEAASGIVGLIKVLLSLEHHCIPRQINLRELNPAIHFDKTVAFPRTAQAWTPSQQRRRYASVSAFGFSGSNAHVIVADALSTAQRASAHPSIPTASCLPMPVVISANNREALKRQVAAQLAFAGSVMPTDWIDYAYTLSCRREHFATRRTFVADTAQDLLPQWREYLHADAAHDGDTVAARQPRIIFAFSGQGMPLVGVAERLFVNVPVFREALLRCDMIAMSLLGQSFISTMRSQDEATIAAQPQLAQALHFSLQYALAETLMRMGVKPAAVLGHSLGEYCAWCLAGSLSLEDAMRLVVTRGRLVQALAGEGAMLAVFEEEAVVRSLLAANGSQLDVACVNTPRNIVVSGVPADIDHFAQWLGLQQIKHSKLKVQRAYHSRMLDTVTPQFEAQAQACTYHAPAIKVISTVDGQYWPADQAPDAHYFATHLRGEVRFDKVLQTLSTASDTICIDIGTTPMLVAMATIDIDQPGPLWQPTLRKSVSDWRALLDCLAGLSNEGVDIDWPALFAATAAKPMHAPGYAFADTPHWFPLKQSVAPAMPVTAPVAIPAVEQTVVLAGDSTPSEAKAETLVDVLATRLAQQMRGKASDIDTACPFLEMGVDSIVLVQFLRAVSQDYAVPLPLQDTFEHFPSIDRLAAYLTEKLAQPSPQTVDVI